MHSKKLLLFSLVPVLALSLLLLGSFTASLYLPHYSPWWRVAMIVLIVINGFSAVRYYLRRL
jgi:hypothetical protein